MITNHRGAAAGPRAECAHAQAGGGVRRGGRRQSQVIHQREELYEATHTQANEIAPATNAAEHVTPDRDRASLSRSGALRLVNSLELYFTSPFILPPHFDEGGKASQN